MGVVWVITVPSLCIHDMTLALGASIKRNRRARAPVIGSHHAGYPVPTDCGPGAGHAENKIAGGPRSRSLASAKEVQMHGSTGGQG